MRSLHVLCFSLALLTWLAPQQGISQSIISMEITFSGESGSTKQQVHEIRVQFQELFQKFITKLELGTFLTDCRLFIRFEPKKEFWGTIESDSNLTSSEPGCEYFMSFDQSLIGTVSLQLAFIHELMHLIRHRSNPHEARWLDEGLAQLVETEHIQLWPFDRNNQLLQQSRFRLFQDPSTYTREGSGYSTSYFFLKYLFNRFGEADLVRLLLTSSLSGWNNIENALQELSHQGRIQIDPRFLTRESIWTHFAFALLINDPARSDYGLFLIDYKFNNDKSRPLFRGPKGASVELTGQDQIFYCPLMKEQSMKIEEYFQSFRIYLVSESGEIRQLSPQERVITSREKAHIVFVSKDQK